MTFIPMPDPSTGMEAIKDKRKWKLLSLFQNRQSEGCQYCGGGQGDFYIPEEKYEKLIADILFEFPEE